MLKAMCVSKEWDSFLQIYLISNLFNFIYFMIKILFFEFSNMQIVRSFKILNNVLICILLNL